MKWYEALGISVLLCFAVYIVIAPWLSIMDIHKSIDRLTDEIRRWREESNNG